MPYLLAGSSHFFVDNDLQDAPSFGMFMLFIFSWSYGKQSVKMPHLLADRDS